jgi:hypothetical protein
MQLLSFALGILTGIILSILVIATLIFFKKPIEKRVEIIEREIERMGPRQKGFIIEPESDEKEANKEFRARVIAKNKELGRDTPIKELL